MERSPYQVPVETTEPVVAEAPERRKAETWHEAWKLSRAASVIYFVGASAITLRAVVESSGLENVDPNALGRAGVSVALGLMFAGISHMHKQKKNT